MPLKQLTQIPGIGETSAQVLLNEGYATPSDIIKASAEDLLKLPGFGEKKIQTIKQAALDFVQQQTDVAEKATESPSPRGIIHHHGT